MRIGQRPALEITWIRDDRTLGEARYRVQLFGKDMRVFDVRISLTAKAQAKPSPEEKIAEWFKHNPLATPGTSERIPDHPVRLVMKTIYGVALVRTVEMTKAVRSTSRTQTV